MKAKQSELINVFPHNDLTDEELYGTVDDPVGHRFGKLTSVAVCITSPRYREISSVLFRCDCGQFRRVLISAIKQQKIPEMCHKCESEIDNADLVPLELIQEYPTEFRQWKNLRSKFSRGWKKFENFIRDTGHRPKDAKLARYDRSKPFSKTNWYWTMEFKPIKGIVDGREYSGTSCCSTFGITPRWFIKKRNAGVSFQQIVEEWVKTHPMRDLWFDVPNTGKRYQVNPASRLVKDGNRILNPEASGDGEWVYTINYEVFGKKPRTYAQLELEAVPPVYLKSERPEVESTPEPVQSIEPVTIDVPQPEPEPKTAEPTTETTAVVETEEISPSGGSEIESGTGDVFSDPEPPIPVVEQIAEPEPTEAPQETLQIKPETAFVPLDDQIIVQPTEAPQSEPESVTEPTVETPTETAQAENSDGNNPPDSSPTTGELSAELPATIQPTTTPNTEGTTQDDNNSVTEEIAVDGLTTEVAPPPPPVEKKKLTVEESSQMVKKMISDGQTIEQIAAKFGTTVEKIQKLASL